MDTALLSMLLAAGVIAVAAIVLLVLSPRGARDVVVDAREATFTGSVPISPADQPDAQLTLAAAEAIGRAMTQAGYSVETVQNAISDIARVNGLPETEALVFPSALLVSARGQGQHQTGAVVSDDIRLLLSQIDELQRTVDAARKGVLSPRSVVEKIARIREMPPVYGPVPRVVAYGLLSGALSVLLGASWSGVLLAAGLGLVAGTTMLVAERMPRRYGALNTVALSFGVAVVVFLLLRAGLGYGILPALLAPLVLLLPGTLLTTAMLELATGNLISGAGRLAGGATRLLLLGAGIATAAVVVGIPDVDIDIEGTALGPLAPWIAVAVLGVGISVHSSAPRRALPWMLLVLYVAYAVQVLSDQLVGGVLSAFIGALVLTPVTALVARQPTGPAALVTFTAGYWLLVPGALGLIGVTSLLEQDSAAAASLLATLSTMLAIALGVLAGSAVSNRLDRPAL
ncbi:threonine/serine ThrE exporter family protein [Microbacterium hominis]|uniref:Threonine/serine exporter family protein n=1 Tax=Microbacterium hominis TaxID=162426 RepID=A0A7D4PSH7_9MICO|nr:threonine/serine exporter family protein [Microbacterium hominis]QKJ18073.1 threonine/serine exporter family protein [Microbacterium hominis]